LLLDTQLNEFLDHKSSSVLSPWSYRLFPYLFRHVKSISYLGYRLDDPDSIPGSARFSLFHGVQAHPSFYPFNIVDSFITDEASGK
jgi:hypothetical protein